MLEEIQALYQGEKFRFSNSDGDVIIGEVETKKTNFTIKGQADEGELSPGQTYSFYGRWSSYKNKRTGDTEKQFHFQSFVQNQPAGKAGVVSYLIQAGQGNRVGPVTANKIWQQFGEDSIRIAREEPETINRLFGIRIDYCEAVSKWLRDRLKLEQVTIRLTGLLNNRGFPKSLPKKLLQQYGNRSVDVIKRNPFVLMDQKGVGFLTCDKFYLSLGLRADRLRRQAFAAWYSIHSDSSGHTWYPVQFVKAGINRLIGNGARVKRALQLSKKICELGDDRHGALAFNREENETIVESGGSVWVAEGKKSKNEKWLAKLVADATVEGHQWPDVDVVAGISDHQRNELKKALTGPIAILGGSPGTGKTFSAAALIKAIAATIGLSNISVSGPTGKSAVRITEVMNDYGIDLTARSNHSMLGVDKSNATSGGDWVFQHNETNPLKFKVLIIDESSMIDTDMMCCVLRARSNGTHVLFLGDVNQLPPVGHGAPLRDLIAAGLPYGELTEIMRNSGGIVESCAAMRDGEQWEAGDNLRIDDRPEQIESIVDQLRQAEAQEFDPVWDCQVVVAVNEKSPLSRKAVNEVLQAEFNDNPKMKGSPFRKGDKIVCLKNGNYPLDGDVGSSDSDSSDSEIDADEDGKVYVANGELAAVVSVQDKFYVAKLTSPDRVIRIPRGKSDDGSSGCFWDLGYALSVHKSQGSEWPVVLVVLDEYPGARRVCDRSWIYTAISRAKELCVLIGKKSTADSMCRRQSIANRKTFLKEQILLNCAEMELVGL